MSSFFKNPISVWMIRLLKAKKLEYRNKQLKIGYMSSALNCNFGRYNTLFDGVNLNNVKLGDCSYVSDNTKIFKTRIGKFCSIGPNCNIGLGVHPLGSFVSTHPAFYSVRTPTGISFSDKNYIEEHRGIKIGNDVWIGSSSLVLDGVVIGNGAIIAAGSVVTKDVPAYAVVGGVPAKFIKYRFPENEIIELEKIKWWDTEIELLKNNFKSYHNVKEFLFRFVSDR